MKKLRSREAKQSNLFEVTVSTWPRWNQNLTLSGFKAFVPNHKPPNLGASQESKQGVGVLAPGERKRPSSGSVFWETACEDLFPYLMDSFLFWRNDLAYHRQQFMATTKGLDTRQRTPVSGLLMLQCASVPPGKPWVETSQCGPAKEEQRYLRHRPRQCERKQRVQAILGTCLSAQDRSTVQMPWRGPFGW